MKRESYCSAQCASRLCRAINAYRKEVSDRGGGLKSFRNTAWTPYLKRFNLSNNLTKALILPLVLSDLKCRPSDARRIIDSSNKIYFDHE